MTLKIGILSIVLVTISHSLANPNECTQIASILACLESKTVEVEVAIDDLTCQVRHVPSPKVRDDYSLTPGIGWHKFHNVAKNWNDARKTCQEEGATLAIINSIEEENLVLAMLHKEEKTLVKSSRKDLIWLGAHNQFAQNDWVTVDGDSLTSSGYINWSKGCNGYPPEPNNIGGTEHCLSLYGKCQGMNDYTCKYNLAFVCEKPDVCS